MRIAHICLSNWFVDGVGYQENELVRTHVADGHEVLVIASTETHSDSRTLIYIQPTDYIGQEGARVVRLPYQKWLPHKFMTKFRAYRGVEKLLDEFKPDSVLFHGTCGWELLTVAKYVIDHPHVQFYVDSHEDQYNSARTLLSRELLHKQFYGRILRSVMPVVRRILCYSPESIDFVESTYGIPRQRLELYPLGGRPIPDEEYIERRNRIRREYKISDSDILIIQSGKQTKRKKLMESLLAFKQLDASNIRFFICGTIDKSIEADITTVCNSDSRVSLLGWKTFAELTDLLCASDIYLQPGTQSVTMQHSLCCRCAVVLDDVPSHRIYVQNNGWLIGQDGTLPEILKQLPKTELESKKLNSYAFAIEHLDYKKLAKRIFQAA
jgi:1,2-diacylglycerol 3-alpha-glucosyltransferase